MRIHPLVALRLTLPFLVLCLPGPVFPGAMAHPVPSESSGATETRTLAADIMLDKVVSQLDLNFLIQILLCIVLGGWLVVIRFTRQESAGFWALLTASLTHACYVHDPKADAVVCLALSLILLRINQSFTLFTVTKYDIKLPYQLIVMESMVVSILILAAALAHHGANESASTGQPLQIVVLPFYISMSNLISLERHDVQQDHRS
ncbi:hypothetical protein BDP55DRAFT_629555 [Colletotrichum godetiae]|uniref:Uncharacterized protein n=1 Tax=Colletotrichum godetiae TaxID=1209918 RepID=A0AAJ0AQD5_9PEZI|nr:uncharacterized protein BDP55DRAFT_629555 [Colletotrichum godetiae]KAK1688447.1 hypothetical protein BDP55DRAFT_629555 [Colletotrichum godetiae]